jgi:hypothetical protein
LLCVLRRTVTDTSTGAPLGNICVQPQELTPIANLRANTTCTDKTGHYATAGVPAGSY